MSHRLQVLIPESLHARVRKAAERAGTSRGEWVRRAIERALDRDRAAPDPVTRLASLEGPTADLEQLVAEIEAGRG